jgi:hypothetical protein
MVKEFKPSVIEALQYYVYCLVDIEIDECPSITTENHLIGRICLFAHLNIHDGRIIFSYAPVIRAMAIVVDSFVGHLCRYFTLCGIAAT